MSAASEILLFTQNYTLYVNCITFVVGLIGNFFNILIFTNLKVFRGNRCAFYLLVESIASIAVLIIMFLIQIFQVIYGTDPGNLSLFWCKLKTTLIQSCRLCINSIICFEAFDQFLSTNHRIYLRQMNTLKLAKCLIFVATSVWILQTIPYIIFYDIVDPLGCIITSQGLKQYYAFVYYIFLNGILPISITCLFSILAYRNVRYLVRRQIPIERRRLDRQLTAMIFSRVIIFVILLLPYTIYRIYVLNVNTSPINSLPYAINQLISAIVTPLLIWIYSLNFYIFLVISKRFRGQVKYFLKKKYWKSMKQWCGLGQNVIHPTGGTSSESGMELE